MTAFWRVSAGYSDFLQNKRTRATNVHSQLSTHNSQLTTLNVVACGRCIRCRFSMRCLCALS